jgi:hypothetical protein
VDETTRFAGIYLRDHYAGSVAGLELVARARRSKEGSELGEFLARLEPEIREDQAALLAVMRSLGAEPSRVKNGLAWTAEKAGRLKLNGRIVRPSPLSTVVELEGLAAGILLKRSLWTSLEALGDPRLAGHDFAALAARAEEQAASVEEWKRRAAAALREA